MIRVVDSNSPLVPKVLQDYRLEEAGQRYCVRVKGEGKFVSSAFPEFSQPGKILLEYVLEQDHVRPHIFWRWLLALRIPYLAFSFFPLILVSGLLWQTQQFPWTLIVLLYSSLLFVHLSCNLWGEYEDHLRGVDTLANAGGSGVIQKLWIPAVHIRNVAALLLTFSLGLGIFLFFHLPENLPLQRLLALGLIGALGAASYSGWPFHYKYLGWGEPIVFLLSGPILTLGASYLLLGSHFREAEILLLSLPLAALAVLRLHCGNLQKIPFDTMAQVFTISRLVGFSWGKTLLLLPLALAFGALCASVALGWAPRACLMALLALPFAWQMWQAFWKAKGPLDPYCIDGKTAATRLQWMFGALYACGFFF
jgi:1,4-dihydroxy-2-naphthoate octaprenyltransferase